MLTDALGRHCLCALLLPFLRRTAASAVQELDRQLSRKAGPDTLEAVQSPTGSVCKKSSCMYLTSDF